MAKGMETMIKPAPSHFMALCTLFAALLAALLAPGFAMAADSRSSAPADATAGSAKAPAGDNAVPTRYGMSAEFANTYDPVTDISVVLATGFALFDYGEFWHQDRPKELCFKIEGAIGSRVRPNLRTVASIGMLALYYLDMFADREFRPYVEAGIGAIYTDYQVPGQGLRFNFNPQLGLGAELRRKNGNNLFAAFRLHHFSNAELNHDNRGVNSLVLQVGRFF